MEINFKPHKKCQNLQIILSWSRAASTSQTTLKEGSVVKDNSTLQKQFVTFPLS